VIVDVGAFIGVYALAAQAANPGARVFGFEPLQSAFDVFEANCAANASAVRAVRAALGDRDGEADLFYGDDSDTPSLGRPHGRRHERVPIRTLESFLREQGVDRVDLLKVDVETFEPAVLSGMGGLLGRSRPAMILEVLEDGVGRELVRLSPPGYAYFHIDESRGLVRTDRVGRVSHRSRNYLFCDTVVAESLENA
jgi:FkbM family methyltransferase